MPFLRFTRDRRGYENTYVIHTYRRRGKAHNRILYWFRTPPNVKVGRAALDEEAIRTIEDRHPDLAFDWTRMLKERVPLEVAPREAPRKRRGAAPRAAMETVRAADSTRVEVRTTELEEREALAGTEEAPEGSVDQAALATAPVPIETLVGAEGLARLQARHAELQARISESVQDPLLRDQMRAEAETVDPMTWVTIEEAKEGLATFDARIEAIRAKVSGRHRRRRGRRRKPQAATDASSASAQMEAQPEQAKDSDAETDK
ncbi:MAG: hypothetical protein HYX76_08545 [Acidobacteria bacterium]|nr:hypothetical protein [Acidobacteriota bacterium]